MGVLAEREAECSDPPCDHALMVAISPMHPLRYIDLACTAHREKFVTANPVFKDYEPERGWREGTDLKGVRQDQR